MREPIRVTARLAFAVVLAATLAAGCGRRGDPTLTSTAPSGPAAALPGADKERKPKAERPNRPFVLDPLL